MKQRSVQLDPQQGDVLKFQQWSIAVLRREGDQVTYRAAHKDGRVKPDTTCSASEFASRAEGSTVVERALEEGVCVTTAYVAGRCSVDGYAIDGPAHCVGLDVFCEHHCPTCRRKSNAA